MKAGNFTLQPKNRNVSSIDVVKTCHKHACVCADGVAEGKSESVCVFCWDDSWFSLVFRYQPVDIIQPTNHVLPASFGDSDWHIVTGNSVTTTNESPRRKPSQHELEKQRMPGDYFLLFILVVKTDWALVPFFFFLCPFPLPAPSLFPFLAFPPSPARPPALLSCRA